MYDFTGFGAGAAAGAWKKGTALRPRNEHPLDADLVFFLNVDEAAAEDVAGLNATLAEPAGSVEKEALANEGSALAQARRKCRQQLELRGR